MRTQRTIREVMTEMQAECAEELGGPCMDNCIECAPDEIAKKWLPHDKWTRKGLLTSLIEILDDWEQYEIIRKQKAL